jgi:hypothetical protein
MSDVAVVLGVGDMGIAIARRIGVGRRLLLADRNQELCAARAAEFVDAGFDAIAVDLDVSSAESVAALAARAAADGAVRAVAHTAGVSPVNGTVDAIIDVDLVGTAHFLEIFGATIAPGGSAVVIASMAAVLFPPMEADFDRALATTPARGSRSSPTPVTPTQSRSRPTSRELLRPPRPGAAAARRSTRSAPV